MNLYAQPATTTNLNSLQVKPVESGATPHLEEDDDEDGFDDFEEAKPVAATPGIITDDDLGRQDSNLFSNKEDDNSFNLPDFNEPRPEGGSNTFQSDTFQPNFGNFGDDFPTSARSNKEGDGDVPWF